MDAHAYFAGKKITVLGLGLLGRGVGDARFLAEQGADLIVTDLKSEEELAPSLAQLGDFPNIRYTLGEHRTEDFQGRDFILKAAGVPDPSPYLDAARAEGTPIKMSASWFAELSGVTCVGITGTRGKSTTTHMIHAILERAGHATLLGGNVRGVSTLALLPDVTADHIAVLELDSWQCQGWGEAKMSPHIAVFSTFYPDHLNYYHDLDAYLADKANIFLYQEATDTLVLGAQCAELIEEKYGDRIQASVVTASDLDFRADWELQLPGEHNRYDAALAVEAARALSVDDEDIKAALADFKGVPGRLEFVREVNGVKMYNDTTATTPDATIAALRALDPKEEHKVTLIMGGADKGLDMTGLSTELSLRTKRVIMLAGSGTSRISHQLENVSIYDDLKSAFDEAVRSSSAGDIVLLSPGFASFGMFKNEYDRGDQFNALVRAL
ncbi:MAG: UDP-N-acetylmuramoyl-L-alanine--D-glutamate ligase [Bacillota bacterium]